MASRNGHNPKRPKHCTTDTVRRNQISALHSTLCKEEGWRLPRASKLEGCATIRLSGTEGKLKRIVALLATIEIGARHQLSPIPNYSRALTDEPAVATLSKQHSKSANQGLDADRESAQYQC